MSEIEFTQFLRPDGRTRPARIERPAKITTLATAILAAGGRFEIEELREGTVSMTVEHPDYEDEQGPVAIELCENGPAVLDAVDKLIRDAHGLLCVNASAS